MLLGYITRRSRRSNTLVSLSIGVEPSAELWKANVKPEGEDGSNSLEGERQPPFNLATGEPAAEIQPIGYVSANNKKVLILAVAISVSWTGETLVSRQTKVDTQDDSRHKGLVREKDVALVTSAVSDVNNASK